MRISVALPQRLGVGLDDIAREVEQLGFDGVFCFDHLAHPVDADRPATEAVAALGTIASATSRVRIGSLVLRVGVRPPHVVAGVARTLAMVAPGRVVVGLGVGDHASRVEGERFGMRVGSLDTRVADLTATLDALSPLPVDVWVGGRNPRLVPAALAAGTLNVWEVDPGRLPAFGGRLTWGGRVAVAGGRPDLLLDGAAAIESGLSRLGAAAVDEVVLTPVGRPDWRGLAAAVGLG